MNRKLLPILTVLFLVLLILAGWVMLRYMGSSRGGDVFDPPAVSTDPEAAEPDEQTGEVAWNYDEFPDDYTFRNSKLLNEHYEKHGKEMGFSSAEEYAAAANLVIHHPDTLHKIEKEDGDTCFYYEEANLFVVLSKDGYIRTFFSPDSGKKYYDKQ